MQEELKNKYQFYDSLLEINKVFQDNKDFVRYAKEELFSEKVYVYTTKGTPIELPKGSTVVDFAYKYDENRANMMTGAVVNDEHVMVDYELKNKDRVKLETDPFSYGSKLHWEKLAKTTYAKSKIRSFWNR